MTAVSDAIWEDILGHVHVHHRDLARSWFEQLEPRGIEHGVLEVRAANAAQQRYLSDHCARAFAEAAQAATGRLVTVRFVGGDGQAAAEPAGQVPTLSELDEPPTLNPDYTFEQFVAGPCNRLAHAACLAVSEQPGRAYNPLFIHGNVGLGKTHLLQATCHRILERSPGARILYLSCESFVNQFIQAVEAGAMHAFRYRYRHVDALIVDDIQFLAERERTQEEFFHTFNTLYQAQKQIILSADSPPKDIPTLEERLTSRFNWGLVARIDPPSLETRMAIVRKKAKLRCIELPEEVIELIALKVESNTRELEGAITRVDALSRECGRAIDLDLARQALGEPPPAVGHQPTIPQIVEVVTQRYNVRPSELRSRKRHRTITLPRQLCMYLARELTNLSLEQIGGYFGGRDHTTVLHAIRAIDGQRQEDPTLDRTVAELMELLQQGG